MSLQPIKLNLKVYQGSTFIETIRWESSLKEYVPITNISKAAPLVVTTAGHTIPANWRVKITVTNGMKELSNALDYLVATSVTGTTLTFNSINSISYTTYVSGGMIEYNVPVDLTSMTARMQIRDKVSSSVVIDELTTENGKLVIDNTTKEIRILVSATATAAYNFSVAAYNLEIIQGSTVIPLLYGNVTLEREITR
jgi:hypothetical protein